MSKPTRKRHSSRLSSPDQHLRAVLTQYPDLHKMVLNLLRGKGKDLPDWPDYCLLPLSGWIAIATRGKTPDTVSVIGEANRLAAVGTWSYSRGIYEIDPDLTTELINTPLTGSIPSEVLTRLPEWCLYVQAPLTHEGVPVEGFWVWLEWDHEQNHAELRFLVDCRSDNHIWAMRVHLGPWTLETAMRKVLDEVSRIRGDLKPSPLEERDLLDYMARSVGPLLSITLYLCSEKPDIDPEPEPDQRPLQIRAGEPPARVLVPAQKTRLFKTGQEIGNTIRRARSAPTIEGTKKRAHLRRGHWHGYWYGPRNDPEQQRFSYRWLHPMLVGSPPDGAQQPSPPADGS